MSRAAALFGLLALLSAGAAAAAEPAAPVAAATGEAEMAAAAQAELDRARALQLPGQPAPYFAAVRVSDLWSSTASASFGALSFSATNPMRQARVDVRVGDYSLDNSNFAATSVDREGVALVQLPTDADALALRRELWLSFDRAYKGAVEELSARKSALEGRPPPTVGSFAPLVGPPVVRGAVPGKALRPDAAAARVTAMSAALRGGEFEEGKALSRDYAGRRLLLTTEGTTTWEEVHGSVAVVEATVRTADGVRLRDARAWVARSQDEQLSTAALVAEVEQMAAGLLALRSAPVEPDYLGPVIFEDEAAVELFRQLLQPELGGTPPEEREPDPYGSPPEATLSARVGRRLLPSGWSVVDDPLADPGAGGAFAVDHEGVPAQRVELVEDGVLKDVLMSRIPRKGAPASNGHARALGDDRLEALPAVVTVKPGRARSARALRRVALRLGREAGLPYVLIIRRVEPLGLTEDFEVALSGDGPLSGLTRPLEVHRLYPDGREERVRGLSFTGVDRRVLRDIAAAGPTGPAHTVLDGPSGPARYSLGAIDGLRVSWAVPAVVVTEVELRSGGGPEPRSAPPPRP